MQYDEVLAVNVVAQSGLCQVLIHLANYRGLHSQVADVLARLLTHYHNQSHGIDLQCKSILFILIFFYYYFI